MAKAKLNHISSNSEPKRQEDQAVWDSKLAEAYRDLEDKIGELNGIRALLNTITDYDDCFFDRGSTSKGAFSETASTKVQPLSRDRRMIFDCLAVASQLAAGHAAFKTDPDGNNVHAEKVAYPHFAAAR